MDVVDLAQPRQAAADHQVEVGIGAAEGTRGLALLPPHGEQHAAFLGAGAGDERAGGIENAQRDHPRVQRRSVGAADLRGQPLDLGHSLAPVWSVALMGDSGQVEKVPDRRTSGWG